MIPKIKDLKPYLILHYKKLSMRCNFSKNKIISERKSKV